MGKLTAPRIKDFSVYKSAFNKYFGDFLILVTYDNNIHSSASLGTGRFVSDKVVSPDKSIDYGVHFHYQCLIYPEDHNNWINMRDWLISPFGLDKEYVNHFYNHKLKLLEVLKYI